MGDCATTAFARRSRAAVYSTTPPAKLVPYSPMRPGSTSGLGFQVGDGVPDVLNLVQRMQPASRLAVAVAEPAVVDRKHDEAGDVEIGGLAPVSLSNAAETASEDRWRRGLVAAARRKQKVRRACEPIARKANELRHRRRRISP